MNSRVVTIATRNERMTFELSKPVTELMRGIRHLRGFNSRGCELRDFETAYTKQIGAREAILTVARTLIFMDATGLRPSRANDDRPYKGRGVYEKVFCDGERERVHRYRNLIDQDIHWDHSRIWRLPSTGQYIWTTEPYAFEARNAKEIDGEILRSSWAGMWNPPSTSLWLVRPSDHPTVPLHEVEMALKRLSPPPVVEQWGELEEAVS